MIIDQLIDKIKQTQNPTVVGLDPRIEYVPQYIVKESYEQYGVTCKGVAQAFLQFNKGIIDEIASLVPAVKPQIAMYEQYGADGIEAYIKTIQYAKEKGLIVIGDIKRGDIQSTAEAYSDGHIGKVKIGDGTEAVYHEDFITLSPYLGGDSITPYLQNCKDYQKGLFILVKTSNPRSGDLQDLMVEGQKLYEKVGLLVEQWGAELVGQHGFSAVGAVVGATYPEEGKKLRALLPQTFFLVPGYGAQGGKAEDLALCFNKDGLGAIVNSSRGIIAAYQSEKYRKQFTEKEFALASKEAVLEMKKDLERVI